MIRFILLLLIALYRYLVSPMFAPSCKYQISCSKYMHMNIQKHGAVVGLYFGLARLASCSSWSSVSNSIKHGVYR